MKKLFTALALVAASAAALAQSSATTTGVDNRQERQQGRIEQGTTSGQLNANEQARLNAQQGRIANAEAKAKADGAVTAKERARLQHKQNKANRNIRRNKHDAQTAS